MECHFGYKLETKRSLARCKLRLEDEFKINVKKPRRRKIDSFTSE
jgi:hypothetical protein